MLMLGVLSVFLGQGEAQEAHGGHHEVVLEVMKNMAPPLAAFWDIQDNSTHTSQN